jgi:hypothetical protein
MAYNYSETDKILSSRKKMPTVSNTNQRIVFHALPSRIGISESDPTPLLLLWTSHRGARSAADDFGHVSRPEVRGGHDAGDGPGVPAMS